MLHFLLYKPLRLYVLCHEITHAISSILIGGKVKAIRITKNAGKITVTKSNLFVAIAPYFIPILPVFITVVWSILSGFSPELKIYSNYFLFILGFLLSFHLLLTVYVIIKGQPDLSLNGFFYSMTFVILGNCLVLTAFLSILFPNIISLTNYIRDSIEGTISNYIKIADIILQK